MLLRDPRAPTDADGRPDGYVDVNGDLVSVADDGTFEHEAIDEQWARDYAERQGATYDEVVVHSASTEDHPTNNDGEPLCTGKEGGQCSRTVDEPGGTCWQH